MEYRHHSEYVTVPIMKASEIAHICQEMNLPVTEEDINNPHPNTMRMILENLVGMYTGNSKEPMNQPNFQALQELSYPELYEDAIPELVFQRALRTLVRACCIGEFTLKDITHPEPKRMKIILSNLLNYGKFRQGHSEILHEVQERTLFAKETLQTTKQKQEMEMQEAQTNLRALKAKREAEEPQLLQLKEETSALQAEIVQMNQQQASMLSDINQRKKEDCELTDKIANHRFQIMNAKQENAKLKSQVVESPEKLKQLIDGMKTSLENERSSSIDAEERSHSLQAKSDLLSRIEKETTKSVKIVEEAATEIAKCKNEHKAVKSTKQQLGEVESHLKELDTQEQHIRRQLKVVNDNTSRLAKQEEQKSEMAQQALEEATLQREEIERQRKATMNIVDQNSNAKQELVQTIDSLKENHQREMETIFKQYSMLETQLQEYHRNLFTAIKSA